MLLDYRQDAAFVGIFNEKSHAYIVGPLGDVGGRYRKPCGYERDTPANKQGKEYDEAWIMSGCSDGVFNASVDVDFMLLIERMYAASALNSLEAAIG